MPRSFETSRPRDSTAIDNNQATTVGIHNYNKKYTNGKCVTSYRSEGLDADTCFSDGTFTDTNTYYEYYNIDSRKIPDIEYYSDESGSTRLPFCEYENLSMKRNSRNGSNYKNGFYKAKLSNTVVKQQKDARRIYPNQDNFCNRPCPESVRYVVDVPQPPAVPKRQQTISDRCPSSQSSATTSAVVDGCGGHCQTFENVCYYFLQVAFTMGILIGTSLSLAGALLRKSAARNVQVLVYIGALLSLVSALLLGVQRNARKNARKRKQALRNAKRAPIQLEVLTTRPVPLQQQQQQQLPLILGENTQRSHPTTVPVPSNLRVHINDSSTLEQSGVPWWRRKDLL